MTSANGRDVSKAKDRPVSERSLWNAKSSSDLPSTHMSMKPRTLRRQRRQQTTVTSAKLDVGLCFLKKLCDGNFDRDMGGLAQQERVVEACTCQGCSDVSRVEQARSTTNAVGPINVMSAQKKTTFKSRESRRHRGAYSNSRHAPQSIELQAQLQCALLNAKLFH